MGFENVLGGRFTAFFAKLLLVCMNGLHDMLKLGYGWIIIIFTFLIKLLFWPLTQASYTVNETSTRTPAPNERN